MPQRKLGNIGDIGGLLQLLSTLPGLLRGVPILLRLLSDARVRELIAKTIDRLLVPALNALGQMFTPELIEAWGKLLDDERVYKALDDLYTSLDPELSAQLSKIVGAVMGALFLQLLENERTREALVVFTQSLATFSKEFLSTLTREETLPEKKRG